jgi:NAD(P)-dependent dehydrogenase (short-subunit alcohol dehydrogenase family)
VTPSKTCLITGANAGIGRAAARQLVAAGHHVLIGCRDRAKGEAVAAELSGAGRATVLELDLASQRSIRAAAARVEVLDVLIHNAAYFDVRAPGRVETPEGVELTWATNHLGPALLTELLLPRLLAREDARVVAVTSKGLVMHPRLVVDLEDPEFRRRRFTVPRAYYHSKLAHLAWMLQLAERHRGTALLALGVRVTNVKVDLARYPGLAWPLRLAYALKSRFSISPDEMAKTYVWLATAPRDTLPTGSYWDAVDRPASVSRWAAEPEHRVALEALTRAQLGLEAR